MEPDPLAAALVTRPRVGAKRVVATRMRDGRLAVRKDWVEQFDAQRLRHEATMLAQLEGVQGVPQLIEPFDGTALMLAALPTTPLTSVWHGEPLDQVTLLRIAEGAARVLADVHARGVVHKNLTPESILLLEPAPYGVLLVDFDLATTFMQERPAFLHHDRIAGDLHYIAPEQTGRTGWTADHRADLYSLGATLYTLATGSPPFAGDEPLTLVRAQLSQLPMPPATANPALRQDLSQVIMRLLEKEPDRRYQSAAGLAHDLAAIEERAAAGGPSITMGERDFAERLSPPSRLVGRDKEISRLKAAFDSTLHGPAQAVLIRGAPGVGKSALIGELRPVVTGAGGWFVAGKFDQYRRGERFGAVAQALRSLAGLLLCEPDEELAALRSRLTAELAVTAGAVAAFLPELALLTGVPPDPQTGEETADNARLVRGCLTVLRVVAERTPVVLAIDDLQWADSFSVALLDTLLADEALNRVLVLGSYRDAEVNEAHPLSLTLARWQRHGRPPAVIGLRNLPAGDLSMFVAEMMRLDRGRSQRLADAILPHTGGNPFDTTELVNALRRAGVLELTGEGWTWDDDAVRRHVRQDDVLSLLADRIAVLSPASRDVLAALAQLGGEVSPALLRAAMQRSVPELTDALGPALQDGLLILDQDAAVVRFPHDRIQQAAYGIASGEALQALHLRLARALATTSSFDAEAAQQYLPVVDLLTDPAERQTAVRTLRVAAAATRLTDALAARHFLTTALTMAEQPHQALTAELHAVLAHLGELTEADELYRDLASQTCNAVQLTDATCVQIFSLTRRQRMQEAIDLGMQLLDRLGLTRPFDRAADIRPELADLAAWSTKEIGSTGEITATAQSGAADQRVDAAARVLHAMLPPAYYADLQVQAWIALESHQLWQRYGPHNWLITGLTGGVVALIKAGDFRGAYDLGRRLEATARAHNQPVAMAHTLWVLSAMAQPWFEPLDDAVAAMHRAQEMLLACGDLIPATQGYQTTLLALIDGPAGLNAVATEATAAMSMAKRMTIDLATAVYEPFHEWLRALREASADDAEDAVGDQSQPNPLAQLYRHTLRAHVALLDDDDDALDRHSAAAISVLTSAPGFYVNAMAHLLRALSLARSPGDRTADEFIGEREWLRRRAEGNPVAFTHLLQLVEAERLAADGNGGEALRTYEKALNAVDGSDRLWHRAFIAERAGRAHLNAGHEHSGAALIARAVRDYAAWGATAKAESLRGTFAAPATTIDSAPAAEVRDAESHDRIDLRAVLAAARVLSSETSLDRLRERVADVLGSMTGATAVKLFTRGDDARWTLSTPEGDLSLTDDRAAALAPISVVRFAERMGGQLIVADAVRDGRFLRDPYLVAHDVCSLLVKPIKVHGALRAFLMLENTLSRDAFSAHRLDAVELITGQLAVSLENAQLYASLERKVAERTTALAEANERLEQLNVTDPLTGVTNRRGLDERMAFEWLHARRTKASLAVAMIDIDHFKSYNDTCGHLGGDSCLRKVAEAIRGAVRATDLVARYGGEEFAVLMPATDLPAALVAAERVRAAVQELAIRHDASPAKVVTVSIGCAALIPAHGGLQDKLVEAADSELYEAKRHGRNRVRPLR